MSSPELSIPKTYIGILSRLNVNDSPGENFQIAIILSGPEPARTNFEELILEQIKQNDQQPHTIIVRGLPDVSTQLDPFHTNVTMVNFLNAAEINSLIENTQTLYVGLVIAV